MYTVNYIIILVPKLIYQPLYTINNVYNIIITYDTLINDHV